MSKENDTIDYVIQYACVSGYSLNDIEESVYKLLLEETAAHQRWAPTGGVTAVFDPTEQKMNFYQAMVLIENIIE